MGKRTAAEAKVDDDVFCCMNTRQGASDNESADRQLLESPVPLAWSCASVEPAGAYDTRVRASLPKQVKLPMGGVQQDNQSDQQALPPLVAPRPRRVVSSDLIFQASSSLSSSAKPASLDLSSCRSFRPIGADRPDVEITSPPPRAANPVAQDTRFRNMQRLDLRLDARTAPLQPFYRPYAQRRVVQPQNNYALH